MAYTRKITNIDPYWDDYASYRNFMRVIFNPSRAVQARELTQMQTAGQNQLEKMANHIFKDGSPIIGAKVEVTDNAPFIEILAVDVNTLADAALGNEQNLVGQHIQKYLTDPLVTEGTLAQIIAVDNNSGTLRMQLNYRGGEFAVAQKWASTEYFDDDFSSYTKYKSIDPNHISAIGSGLRARVETGTVWINGFFVEIQEQEIFVSKSGNTGSFSIGYEFEEITLTTNDTTELDQIDGATLLGDTIRDPAGTSNSGAPGADRYMVNLNLVSYDTTNPNQFIKNDGTLIGDGSGPVAFPDTFHQIIKMTDGVVQEKIEKTQYSDILDMLAERTYDESGSYTIEPYSLLASTLDAANFNYEVGPGRAYIYGYERENIVPVKIPATKTRTVRARTVENNIANYGTYVIVRDIPTTSTFDGDTISLAGSPTNSIFIPDHGYGTGDKLTFTQGSGSIGIANGDYYVIRINDNYLYLASSVLDATNGTNVSLLSITGTTGHTLVGTDQTFGVIDPTELETGYLMSGYNGAGIVISSVKVWFINDINQRTRIYLGDNTELLSDLASTKSICAVSTGNPSATDSFMNIDEFNSNQTVGFNQTIVPLLGSYVKEVTAVNYSTLIKIGNKTVPSGSYTLATGDALDTFQGGASDPESAIAYLVNTITGEVIDYRDAAVKVFGTNPTGGNTATITADADHTLTPTNYDFYMIIDRAGATVRSKTLTEVTVDFTTNAGSSLNTVILNNTNNNGELAGAVAPHYDIAALGSVHEDPIGTNIDVTTDFTFDDGQKDIFYDYGSIIARDGGTFKTSKTYRVVLHVWAWGSASGTGDFFAANSYLRGTDGYFDDKSGVEANIPLFLNDQQTKTWVLRDCLDYRRNITEISLAKEIAEPVSTTQVTYDYYLPRWDKIWIDSAGKLGVTEGIAEEFPSTPPDLSGAVTLFTAYLAPYVYDPYGTDTNISAEQINIRMVDHRNYTMDDIRKLETRIRGLEAYTSETQLELDSYADTIVDKDGLARAKNGIFVDKFTDHKKGSVSEPGYRCSMDQVGGMLHCPFEMNSIRFEYDPVPAAGGTQTNISEGHVPVAPEVRTQWENTITLDYSTTQWLEQPLASETMNINPFAVVVWAGEVIMNPASDTWIETQWIPALQIQDPIEASKIRALYENAGAGIPHWGAWRTQVIGVESSSTFGEWEGRRRGPILWNGVMIDPVRQAQEVTTTTTTTSSTTRTGTVLEESGSEMIFREMGERTVDVSQIPWMRTIDIEFQAFGLRPDSVMVPYFAKVDISADVVWDANHVGGLTNKAGYVKGVFTVPEKEYRTGKNVFTLKDAVIDPLSIASVEFRAEGTLYTKQKEILSVEVPTYSTRAIFESEEAVSSEVTSTRTRWTDPISQTFLIEDTGGIFLESIDVFFATKDRYLPVSLYIVETIAGVPGQKRVPFSLVNKDADDIDATYWDVNQPEATRLRYEGKHYDTEGTVEIHDAGDSVAGALTDFKPTKFSFSDAVYLKEGVEYAFVLVSNSNNYNVYISRMGNFDIISGTGITKQPHLGSLLKSQNTSTWTPDQYADIKFSISRCDFDNSANALYMRTVGETPYWEDIVYAPGDQIIFDHTTDGLNVYQNLTATVNGNGDSPENTPALWSLIRDGFFDATNLNITLDDLVIPTTSVTRQYLSDPDTTWIEFTNKEDIPLETKDTIELFSGGVDPRGINLKLQLSTDTTKLSPVINKNRSSAILINNLVRTPDADAPSVPTTPNFDAGEYISESTLLKENAATLKLLIDVKRPNENAIIVPKYRIVKENLRYVDWDTDAIENILSDQDLKDEFAYVYYLDSDMVTVTSILEKGSVIVDGIDTVNNRIYLSSIEEPADFNDKTSVGMTSNQEWIFITTEPDIIIDDISIWDGTEVLADSYSINPADKNLYVANVDTFAPPTPNSLDWTQIPIVYVDQPVQLDLDVDWREMDQVGTVNPAVDITQYVEYEYEPRISPSSEFDNFAIKIEMYSADEVNIPECKRLRIIAVN